MAIVQTQTDVRDNTRAKQSYRSNNNIYSVVAIDLYMSCVIYILSVGW